MAALVPTVRAPPAAAAADQRGAREDRRGDALTGDSRAAWRPNLRAGAVAAVTLASGLLLFVAATGAVRGVLGDVLVVVFLTAGLATVRVGASNQRLVAVGALSVGLEALQGLHLVGPEAHWVLHLLLGSTFDPWDLVAYAVGLGVAAGAERAWRDGR